MSTWRKRVETGFEGLARFIISNKYLVAVAVLLFAGACMSQLPKTTVDMSPLGMLHGDSDSMKDYNAFRDRFGRDDLILLTLGPGDVFSLPFLEKLREIHEELEESVPYVDEIKSLANARDTRGEEDSLVVGDLLEEWPETLEDLAKIKNRALENPLYKNLLLSEDARYTTIAIQTQAVSTLGEDMDALAGFEDSAAPGDAPMNPSRTVYLTDEENTAAVNGTYEVVKKFNHPDFPIHVAGLPVLTHQIKVRTLADMKKFLSLTVLMIALILFLIFKRIPAVVWPMATVLLSLFATLGLMALSGTSLKMPTQILPSFLIAVGVADSVHILAIFYRRLSLGDSKDQAIIYSMGHSGLAVLLTSLTTAGGLLSFSTAELAPIADMGIFASIGVILALIFTIFWLPAMLAIFPTKPPKQRAENAGASRLDNALALLGDFTTGHYKKVLLVTLIILIVAISGASRLRFSHYPVVWFPKDADIRIATETTDRVMKGSVTLEMIADTGEVNGWYDPEKMAILNELEEEIRTFRQGNLFVGQSQSLADGLKEINQALNENREDAYEIPKDRRLIAQEYLLFQNAGSDDLEDLVDSEFSIARMSIKAPTLDASTYVRFISYVENLFKERLGPGVRVLPTGFLTLLFRTVDAVMHTMVESYIIAFIVITFLMILLIGNFRVGLAAMIPNLLPILVCMGGMGFLGIHLDAMTILIGSIAIGLAVDDTIHFMYNFRRYFEAGDDVRTSVHKTLESTGRAMLFTSVVLSLGFYVLSFASMRIVVQFGLLTGSAIVLALLADFIVAPALMQLVYRRRENP